MGISDATILHHVCIVFVSLWLLSLYNLSYPIVYLLSLIYLYLVNERYVLRLEKRLQFEERKSCSQRRLIHVKHLLEVTTLLFKAQTVHVLDWKQLPRNKSKVITESESMRWLNYAVKKTWLICMEGILSQKILLPIIPWFLDKYKPWTVKNAVVKHLYLGRSPPLFTELRVLHQCPGDDHLVLELGMNFRSADDMSAILSVKLKRRVGLGMKTKLNLMGMHVEGKMLVGVKFLSHWPFVQRLRVCFAGPPYFQLTVKPIFTCGLDVAEVPGIAGWLDKLLALAFEQTLVEPNMLVIDMEKFASPHPENWFFFDEKEPVAYALVEIIEAIDCKPSDSNGLADPYVKGQIGHYRFRTQIRKKMLSPKWHEEFKVPICTWESSNSLAIKVRHRDCFADDPLGDCSINITDLRSGQRHDIWLPLRNVEMGRLHLAITVVEDNKKDQDQPGNSELINGEENNILNETALENHKMADNIEEQAETEILVEKSESEVSQFWEPKKGKNKLIDTKFMSDTNENSSNEGSDSGKRRKKLASGVKRFFGIRRKKENYKEEFVPSPPPNIKSTNDKKIGVKLILDGNDISTPLVGNQQKSPNKTKSILKHAFARKGSKSLDLSAGSRFSEENSISLSSSGNPFFVSGKVESGESSNEILLK